MTGGSGTYEVTGSVDSENGFGALIRSDDSCSVRLDGEEWQLVSLTGLGQ